MTLYERYKNKQLPGEWQKKMDAFASAPTYEITEEEKLFRAAYYIGSHRDEIIKEIELYAESK